MRAAIRLAQRIPAPTSPNPAVGALIVDDKGNVVAEGAHLGAGHPHAERVALDAAQERAKGATMVVTLAPCTKKGRTDPCLDAVIASGIRRVVIGTIDPNPAEQPGSLDALRAAGIDVVVGVAERACKDLIAGFTKRVTSGRPRVTLKLATSLDGRAAAADRSSRWVTGPGARRDAHRLRAASDAVLIGSGTVIADDPSLTVRLRGFKGPQPIRIALDASGSLSPDSKIFDNSAHTIIATTSKPSSATRQVWKDAGAEVLELPDHHGRVDLAALFAMLGDRGMNDVMVEGGPTLAGELVERKLVDRFVIYVAPKLLGAQGLPSIDGLVIGSIDQAIELTFTSVRHVGADLRLEGQQRH